MFFGAVALIVWQRLSPNTAKVFAIAVASGLIAGEGLMGVMTGVLVLLGFGAVT